MMRLSIIILLSILGLLSMLVSACTSSLRTNPAEAAVMNKAGIHVVHPVGSAPYIADASGNQLLLRGVNSNALIQYSNQPGCSYQEEIPLSASDLSEMSALGFNFLRLPVSQSRIEPVAGKISTTYLSRIKQILQWAATNHIAVLVDMHQDHYNRHLDCGGEADGAPDWATITNSVPCTPKEIVDACAQAAFKTFWENKTVDGQPLQTWYLKALTALSNTVGKERNLAGIELMNEPLPSDVLMAPTKFANTQLYPFYQRMIHGLRSAHYKGAIWFEPSILRDMSHSALAEAHRFSSDPNLIYAVHTYTGVFFPPGGNPGISFLTMKSSYQNATLEATKFGTPWVADEFGAGGNSAWNNWFSEEISLQNSYTVGSAVWVWKQAPGFYNWNVVRRDGTLRNNIQRIRLLSQPHVDTIPPRLLSTSYNNGRLVATVDGKGGTATFWATSIVSQKNSTTPQLLEKSLTTVHIDGSLAPGKCSMVIYNTPEISLAGCRLVVHIPPGRHTIVLS
ncbi:MAG: glycoside hydrolase family 5 protein [Actinobacteria bacterium]|nr:glycoside hydrolase family 5 protein [Actinomycetota bacterium]